MLKLIPYELRDSPQYQAIFGSSGEFLDVSDRDIDDLLDQTFIDNATWSLELWEKEFNVETDTTKSLRERRSVVKSKKRGIGVVTVAMVKDVAEAYYGGEVEVYEQYEKYVVEVKFVSDYGIPSNLEDVEDSLKEILPAHLDLVFLYSYFLVEDIHNVMIISELERQTFDKFAFNSRGDD